MQKDSTQVQQYVIHELKNVETHCVIGKKVRPRLAQRNGSNISFRELLHESRNSQ